MDVLILRVESPDHVIAQVCATDAVVGVKLNQVIPIRHMGMARTVTPYKPVPAKIVFGTLDSSEQVVHNCRLEEVHWPKPDLKARMTWF